MVEKVFDSIAVTLNGLLLKFQGDEFLHSLRLLEECRHILKKAEEVFREYPALISSPGGLEAYNRVVAMKPLYETLISKLGETLIEQLEVLMARRWSSNSKLYASENTECPPIDLKDICKHLENMEFPVLSKQPRPHSVESFLRAAHQCFDAYIRKTIQGCLFTRRGLDIFLEHANSLAELICFDSFRQMYAWHDPVLPFGESP